MPKVNKEIIFNEHADKLNAILKLGYYLSVCYFEQIEYTLLHTAGYYSQKPEKIVLFQR